MPPGRGKFQDILRSAGLKMTNLAGLVQDRALVGHLVGFSRRGMTLNMAYVLSWVVGRRLRCEYEWSINQGCCFVHCKIKC